MIFHAALKLTSRFRFQHTHLNSSSNRLTQPQQLVVQAMFPQPLAEAHLGRFIRHGVLQTQPDKAPPAQAVADQFLALRIGQALAMLEQTHFEGRQRGTRRKRIAPC